MKNFWLNKIDRALLWLGYDIGIINFFNDKEKESLIIDEYLFRMREDTEDVLPLSLEEMAEYIIDYQRSV